MKSSSKKMGRPAIPVDLQKRIICQVAVDEYQLQTIDSACEVFGLTRSELIRYFLFQSLEPLTPILDPHADEDSPAYPRAAAQAFHIQQSLSRPK